MNMKHVLIFCTNFVGNIYHSKRNLFKYYYKFTSCLYEVPVVFVGF